MQRRTKLGLAGAALLTLGAIVAATRGWAHYHGAINARHVDLAAPDAYIWTPALSRLPRDLVKAPLARDVLTQDFAFYYEDNDERAMLAGTLKRIAFEHDTTMADKLRGTGARRAGRSRAVEGRPAARRATGSSR